MAKRARISEPDESDRIEGFPHPRATSNLVGQDVALSRAARAIRGGKPPQGWLISGPPGIGKATFAYRIARYLLTYGARDTGAEDLSVPANDPNALQVTAGSHPGLMVLKRGLNEKTGKLMTELSVSEVRRLAGFFGMTSGAGGWRVAIVDTADDMNTNAANALLKLLEEPPSRAMLILLANRPGQLLPTIRSRCQVIRLTPLDADDLLAVLQTAEPPPPDDPAARAALVERAGGSARNAILLTQYGGLEIAETLDALVAKGKGDIGGAYRLAEAVAGRDQAIQFDIFNRRALDLLSDAASQAALAGDLARAKTLSDTWHEALDAISETDTYNLDKKQHALTMIDRLNSAMRM